MLCVKITLVIYLISISYILYKTLSCAFANNFIGDTFSVVLKRYNLTGTLPYIIFTINLVKDFYGVVLHQWFS